MTITRTHLVDGPSWTNKPVLSNKGWENGDTGEVLIALHTPTVTELKATRATNSLETKATGSVTFDANPEADSTIVLNGITWTFKSSGATGNETDIGADLAATLTDLETSLNASVEADIAGATYTASATTIDIEFDTEGDTGNAFTLDKGTAALKTSNTTLTGGSF